MKNVDETKTTISAGVVWFQGSFDRLIATLRDDGRSGNERSIAIDLRDAESAAPGSLHITRRQAAALRDALNDWARANDID